MIMKKYVIFFAIMLYGLFVTAQQQITGTVTDKNNLPVEGVQITVQNTN